MDKNKHNLKTILNVKQFAKNLRDNANNFQKHQYDDYYEINSTPSLMNATEDFWGDDIGTPSLNQGSSFRQGYKNKNKKNYQYSLNINGREKHEGSFERKKHSSIQDDEKDLMVGKKLDDRKYGKTEQLFNRVKRIKKTEQSGFKNPKQQKRERQDSHKLCRKCLESVDIKKQKPEVVKELLQEITFLNQQINNYKHALLVVKDKYQKLEEKAIEKVHTDHYVDVLKEQISQLQEQNVTMKSVIDQQNRTIAQFNENIANFAEHVRQCYSQEVKQISTISVINQILLKMTKMQASISQPILETSGNKKVEEIQQKGLCRSQEEFCKKWSAGKLFS